MSERLTLVAAVLAVPWTVLGGLMWWEPARPTGSSPWLRRAVYAVPVVLTALVMVGLAFPR